MSNIHPLTLESYPIFRVPLTRLAHQEAQAYYHPQKNSQKAKEIYLNYLAIYAVDYYLNCFGIMTKKEDKSLLAAINKTLLNVAELEIIGQGKIECRPVLPQQKNCYIPTETWQNRIGYVAVKFNQALTEAKLMGFIETVNQENVPLSNFQTMDTLWKKISVSKMTILSQWLTERIEQGWQDLQDLLNPKLLTPIVRSSSFIQQGKMIYLSSLSQPLILGVVIQKQENSEFGIVIEVFSSSSEESLPTGLEMQILDENQTPIMQALSKDNNPYLRFFIKGKQGDSFTAKLSFKSIIFAQNFII